MSEEKKRAGWTEKNGGRILHFFLFSEETFPPVFLISAVSLKHGGGFTEWNSHGYHGMTACVAIHIGRTEEC